MGYHYRPFQYQKLVLAFEIVFRPTVNTKCYSKSTKFYHM